LSISVVQQWLYRCFVASLMTMLSVGAVAQAAQDSPLELRGDFVQGGLIFGQAKEVKSVVVNGKSLRLTDAGAFVFGIDRDAPKQLQLQVVDGKGLKKTLSYSVAQRKYDIQRIDGVEQKHVTPPKEVLDRIAKEAAKVKRARLLNDARPDFMQDFIWPLKGRITGVYGSQRVYNGAPGNPHFGVDIAGPVGAVVRAPSSGLVTLAEQDLYFSGGTLILDHGHGLSSTFIHLSKLLVKSGERIERGQPIAEVGATGRATGPHLDWRMNWFEVRVDPQLFMHGKPM
jgi:murein DD-endopeptidase MepM/ murein hydrolase activator NlpD